MTIQDRPWRWEEDGYVVTRGTAWSAPGCHEGCGVLLYTKDGKLLKVEGDPQHPFNQGRLCPRCLALRDVVYHPDRLNYPLKRVGKRGEGKWERISWDEAYDIIEKRFKEIAKEYGPESIVGFRGTGREAFESRLLYAIGTPNEFPALTGISCYLPRIAACMVSVGAYLTPDLSQLFEDRYDNPEWKAPECILVWGLDPIFSNAQGLRGSWFVDCMKRGSKLIVVDPRLIWLASRADVWLQIRPGTDAALALGLLNIVIREGLYDREFVDKWTHGFDKLAQRASEYPVDRVSEITWVPQEKILTAARLYAKSKAAVIQMGVAVDMQKTGVQACQTACALMAICGNLDVPGGNIPTRGVFGINMHSWGFRELLTEGQQQKLIGYDEHPLIRHGMAYASPDIALEQMVSGKPYPIRGAWIQATNILPCMCQDPKRWYEAIQRLDFVAAVDLFMNPTIVAFADVVLPAATYPEKDGIRAYWDNISPIVTAVDRVGECKSDLEIELELGKRFSEKAWPWASPQEVLDEVIKPSGMTFEELRDRGWVYPGFQYKRYEKGLLRPDGQPGFMTPTGKVELLSTTLEALGLNPLPYFEEPTYSPVRTPELYEKYPLILMTGVRSKVFFHSEHRQVPWLREIHPDPIVEIHPETAANLGIKEGDWVWIENQKDRIRQKAKVTPIVHPKMVLADHGWWFPEKPGPDYGHWEVNINRLLEVGLVGETGFGADMKCALCKVYKVKEGEL